MRNSKFLLLAGVAALALAGCGNNSHLPRSASYGPNPPLPAPEKSLIPEDNTATIKTWPAGVTPTAAKGLAVNAFAEKLDHPRWIYVLPNGDVLVAETNKGTSWADTMGYGGYVESLVRRIEGLSTKSANRITLLRDTKGAGVADVKTVFLSGLNAPFGMALVGNTFYVADTDALLAFPYHTGETHIAEAGRKVTDLPGGDIDHHWTKNVIANADGSKLYVTVGSNSNAGENGLDVEKERAAIWEVDPKTGAHRIFASGIRNPNGLGWSPGGKLWTAVNERDEMGGDLVPDYMTSVKDGAFYGWPWSYYGQHVDNRVTPANPQMVAKAIPPDYALGTHTASLGLAFAQGAKLGADFSSGVFIGQHGSWNRKPRNGYDVVFVPFKGETPSGPPVDVLTGFLTSDGVAYGRPVGVAIDKAGDLLVADDTGNVIWRVTRQ
ncbi:MAG TPA: sorbosone dehydrogenase family protein [Rhizomicrobium sp.]|jgi:glucose/arabinose dehydrogenase|nr:sorbosone dehydrogenase family protein [Rhizomicrobium sp.]